MEEREKGRKERKGRKEGRGREREEGREGRKERKDLHKKSPVKRYLYVYMFFLKVKSISYKLSSQIR
jgi:hypothetical protein